MTAPRGSTSLHRWQDQFLNVVLVLFALWTMASHLTVLFGGNLTMVQSIFLGLLTVVGMTFVAVRRRSEIRRAPETLDATGSAHSPSTRLLLVGATLAAVAVLVLRHVHSGIAIWWTVLVPLSFAVCAVYFAPSGSERQPPSIEPPVGGRLRDSLPWVLALLAVVLTLVAHRPDFDDALYVNLAVSAVDHPDQTILHGDTLHGIEGLPIHLPLYKVQSVEMLCAAVARWTGLPAIVCFHWLLASFGAFLVPLALARLLRLLAPRSWPWILVFCFVVLISVGLPHRWYGNFAFVRMWQGKSLFLSVVLPSIQALAVAFALRPSLRRWLLLTAAQISAIGCSVVGLTLGPVVAIIAATAALGVRSKPIRLVAVTASSLYPAVAGLLARQRAELTVYLEPRRKAELGAKLLDGLETTLGDLRIPALAALIACWLLVRSPTGRRFATGIPFLVWVTVLNPYLQELVASHVLGTVFWRGLWLLPIPLLMAWCLASPIEYFRHRPAIGRLAAVGLLAAFVGWLPMPHGLSEENRVEIAFPPHLKVAAHTFGTAELLYDAVAGGEHVVAPDPVGLWLPTMHDPPYPLSVRHYLRTSRHLLEPREWQLRDFMTRFVQGGKRKVEASELADFRAGLDRFDIRGVCLRNRPKENREAIGALLTSAGFALWYTHPGFEIWIRAGRARPRTPDARSADPGS